jgi:hypothetical protein
LPLLGVYCLKDPSEPTDFRAQALVLLARAGFVARLARFFGRILFGLLELAFFVARDMSPATLSALRTALPIFEPIERASRLLENRLS